MVKIRVSYKHPAELKEVLRLLSPVLKSFKMSRNEEGEYRKAYVDVAIGMENDR